jgi:hypothetical protein
MTTIILFLLVAAGSFAGGFYAGLKNANSDKVAKGKELLDALKGK